MFTQVKNFKNLILNLYIFIFERVKLPISVLTYMGPCIVIYFYSNTK